MLTGLDYVVVAVYFLGVAAFGIRAAGRQRSEQDYFLGGRDVPWLAVSGSVIATETSTLTVIGIPAVAYGGAFTFLQLALGFLLGRVVVAYTLLPRYFQGNQLTAYDFLGARFGQGIRSVASATFLLTRLLADGVRLFATAIPIRVLLAAAGIEASYAAIIAVIALVTAAYTLVGGLKAVIWVDVVQMVLYMGGAVLALFLLGQALPSGALALAAEAGKTRVVELGGGWTDWLTSPYALPTAVLGGAVFSMASHGADHLIVQRLLACRSQRDGQKALIASGFGVLIQFALFLLVGLFLWAYNEGADPSALGLTRGDEVFPKFIVEGMPPGISGLLLAGIVAAAMSTLSSSLNALASSTMFDLWEGFGRKRPEGARALRLSRAFTLGWAVVFVGFALLFQSRDNPVVELGLAIASYTYGGLLGSFLLGLLIRRANQSDALIAFGVTVTCVTATIFGLWYASEAGHWVFRLAPEAEVVAELGLQPLAWPLYTVLGVVLSLGVGGLLSLRHAPPASASPERSR